MQKSQELSAGECPNTVKLQKFSLAKLKCYTVSLNGAARIAQTLVSPYMLPIISTLNV